MKFCSNCGTSNEESSIYCLNCGAELLPDESTPQNCNESLFASPKVVLPEQNAVSSEKLSAVKRPKQLWPWILGTVILLLGISATLFHFLILDSEAWKVGSALYRTTSSLNNILDRSNALHTYRYHAEDLKKSGHYQQSGELTFSFDTADLSMSLEFIENINLKHKLTDGTASLSITADGDTLPLEFPFSMNENELMLELSDLLDGTYCINFDTLDDDLQNSPLLDEDTADVLAERLDNLRRGIFPTNSSFSSFFKENKNKILSLIDTIELKEAGTERRQTGGKLRNCTVYSLDFSKKQLSQLISAWQDGKSRNPYFSLFFDANAISFSDLLLDNTDTIHLSIDDRGYLVALDFEIEIFRSETVSFVISLEGVENPWSRVVLSIDNQEIWVGGIEERDGDCIIALGNPESDTGIRLEIKENGRMLSLFSVEYGKTTELLKLLNSEENGIYTTDFHLSQQGMQLDACIRLQEADKEPQMLSENATNLLLMSTEDYEALKAEVEENARNNPVYAWILDEMD